MRRLLSCALACAAPLAAQASTVDELPLPARAGWQAAQLHQSDKGIWYAHAAKVVEAYGAPEIIAADDNGKLLVLSVYSGRWTTHSVNPDGQWLAPSRPADVDPRIPGREVYCAGKAGNVHRVWTEPRPFGRFELRSIEIGHVAGEEFHAVLAGDLDPTRAGDELLVFGLSGAVYELSASREPNASADAFVLHKHGELAGRVRDALVLPAAPNATPNASPRVLAVSRAGHLLQVELNAGKLAHRTLAQEPMGLGRIARAPATAGGQIVVYVTRDDGLLLRFAQTAQGAWLREPIFAGPQGLRGVAAGRFFADPAREAVATFGYGKEVHVISRIDGGAWQAESIYTDADQGHWLTVGEFDGRNGTDELVATGFGGRVVLLSRPAGYALPGAALPAPAKSAQADAGASALRIAVRAGDAALTELSPLNYQGGFETKTMVYETLVRIDAAGAIAPGLAASWKIEDGGKTFVFELREGATFHDGTPVTAAAVVEHFRRWVGKPEHDWLRCNAHIKAVRPGAGSRQVRVELDQPMALLEDLCAINPTAIAAPASRDGEGKFVRALGSGPFRFVEAREAGRVLRYERVGSGSGKGKFVDLVRLRADGEDPLDALARGDVDVVAGSWAVQLDPNKLAALRADPRFKVHEAPGSIVTALTFRTDQGLGADRRLRRFVAAVLDRKAVINAVQGGAADACVAWAAPAIRGWPRAAAAEREGPAPTLPRALRISGGKDARTQAVVRALVAQLAAQGLAAEVSGEGVVADARVSTSHGAPYDPLLTLVGRFVPLPHEKTASQPGEGTTGDARMTELVRTAAATPEPQARAAVYGEIQAALDAEAWVVPIYAARRVVVLRAGLPTPTLGCDMYRLDAEWLTDR